MSSGSDLPDAPVRVQADEAMTTEGIPALDEEKGSSPSTVEQDARPPNGDTSTPEVRRGRIPNHMLQNVALMIVNGAPYDVIASSTGLPHDTIQRLVTEGQNKTFTKYLDTYRDKVLKATTHHQMRLMENLDHAYLAVNRALQAEDERVAVDTAFKLFDRVMPQQKNPAVEVNVGFQNVHLENQVHTTFQAISGKMESLMGRLLSDDPNRYLRQDEAKYDAIDVEIAPAKDDNEPAGSA